MLIEKIVPSIRNEVNINLKSKFKSNNEEFIKQVNWIETYNKLHGKSSQYHSIKKAFKQPMPHHAASEILEISAHLSLKISEEDPFSTFSIGLSIFNIVGGIDQLTKICERHHKHISDITCKEKAGITT